MDKNLRFRQKLLQQEEAREREIAFRGKMRQKRDAFQTLMKQLEVRQGFEREELVLSQRRVAKNLRSIHELEMRSLDELGKRKKANENEISAQQMRMRQQKEAEQLREMQLVKVKHLTELLNREVEDQTSLENLMADQRERELQLEALHLFETQMAQTDLDNAQARIKATHLRERQKQSRTVLETQQRRMASLFNKQTRHAARIRERTMLAQDPLLAISVADGAAGGAGGAGSDDGSDASSDFTASEHGSDTGGEDVGDAEQAAEGGDANAAHKVSAERQKRRTTDMATEDLAEAQEMEVLEQLEKGRERIKTLNRQQRENTTSLRQQQKDQLKMLQTEQKRKLGDLVHEQEDELVQIKGDHNNEMNEMIQTMSRTDVIESQRRQMNKKFDTDSSNGLLGQMLPQHITEELKQGRTPEPSEIANVSLAFIDITGFKAVASKPGQGKKLINLLDSLYKCFDEILSHYPTLYKVETVLDTYMIASGLLLKNAPTDEEKVFNARELLMFSLEAMEAVREIDSTPVGLDTLPLRIGLHTGPVYAGIVGHKMIRYCLFGDVVNVTSRMCSTNEAFKIQTSEPFYQFLRDDASFMFKERGIIPIKGKGDMKTFAVVGVDEE
ncbi:nucleotide cyclase [Blastocladiella britannica]|nr:nucleotide cyclase [Blastocladiella britannica]